MGTQVALLGAWDGGEGVLRWGLIEGSPWSGRKDIQEGDWQDRRTYSEILGEPWLRGTALKLATREHYPQARKMQLNRSTNNPRHASVLW